MALPFRRTSRPPALPTFIQAASTPLTVLVWLGSSMPAKICLPPLVIMIQVRSVADRFRTTWLMSSPLATSETLTPAGGTAPETVAETFAEGSGSLVWTCATELDSRSLDSRWLGLDGLFHQA